MDDPVIFHHGSYDAVFLKKMQALHGGMPQVKTVNALSMIYGRIYFPTYGNSLKEISAHLGFRRRGPEWTGLQSVDRRLEWEASRSEVLRKNLLAYNRDDCEALELLTEHLKNLGEGADPDSAVFCDQLRRRSLYGWGRNTFAFPEFEFVNQRAYFDYQREKIYWRTDEDLKENRSRLREERGKTLPVDETLVCKRPHVCPVCSGRKIIKHQRSSRIVYDLRFSREGVRRWIIKHQNHRYICKTCRRTFHPPDHPATTERYGHGLVAWSVYQYIALRQSQENVAGGLNEIFGFSFGRLATVASFKERAAELYRPAYSEILSKIQRGKLIHADETQVSVKGARHYVWVFTNLEEVAYLHADSREGEVLKEVLAPFKGVLVSDYYPAYDSAACLQQRCLIHLIRDLNDDLFKHPFDLEYKMFVRKFGELLKPIMMTIDRCGLKRIDLEAHKPQVELFFNDCVRTESGSDLVKKYQARILKNEGRLFTFLDHDGVPWNNNNAENAIKAFAAFRRMIGGSSTEKGLRDSLVLLSICQTLRNKRRSSLDFLRSREMSLEKYLQR